MTFFPGNYSFADLINAGLLLVAIFGIYLTYRQIRVGHRTQHATFFKDLYGGMFADKDIRDAYYLIEYDNFHYKKRFHQSKKEKKVDHLLSFTDLVCDLYMQNMLTKHEMDFFKYRMLRIYASKDIKRYLNSLDGVYEKHQIRAVPFESFRDYCKTELKIHER